MSSRPYVISWNLTYRCNLACEHCYLDAGRAPKVSSENFSDRSELATEECFGIVDQIAAFAPEAVTILTGGEPLLRRDILEIIRYAAGRGLWVVVGTNGVKISETLIPLLKDAGVKGFALSLDALDPARHDAFRLVKGAWQNTVRGATLLHEAAFPFIIQTTVGAHNLGDLAAIAEFACSELKAKVWNLYFLVQTGRGQFVSDISAEEYENVLTVLHALQKRFSGKMMVNAKCAPHYVRHVFDNEPDSAFLKTFGQGAGGCPAGTHYMGIRPNGDMTPCPYLPVFGGNLREQGLQTIWEESDLFQQIRRRGESLGGRCGACEFNQYCGGCRARAFGVSGDYLAEDPLCNYLPRDRIVSLPGQAVVYGLDSETKITWEQEAEQRLQQIPAFVRGMVTRSVESYCRKNGILRVSGEALDMIRSKMPTQKIFGSKTD